MFTNTISESAVKRHYALRYVNQQSVAMGKLCLNISSNHCNLIRLANQRSALTNKTTRIANCHPA